MKSDDNFVHEDILCEDETWDDKRLIEAYNKSVDIIKKKISRQMGLVNGIDDEGETVDSKPRGHNVNKWKIGDFCRANYSVDGVEYEAKIVRLLSDGQCIVKYCGYDNEEVVRLKNLKQSLGKQYRNVQKVDAAKTENSASLDGSYENFAGVNYNENHPQWLPNSGVPAIPPPPPLNMLPVSQGAQSENDALSAMLMSWYMSGYHTGYYQGLMQSKKEFHKMPKK